MKEYDPKEIEKKWQEEWEKSGVYHASDDSSKPKYYTLIEFPFLSGEGLHVGHLRPYIGMDVVARKRRMQGYNSLYPIGWDAFGLPAENYAIKTGVKPATTNKKNIENYKKQLHSAGISFDWSREIDTADSNYYKWTQWIFLKFFERGLAYKAKMPINWCPKDKIGLANEEVIDGKCERCGTEVVQKEKEQWMLAITKYADRLDKDLDIVDYPESIKVQQKNWIGRSEGALIKFDDIEVFTTRPDTIFGATFLVKAGKEDKFTGKYVTNPATGEKIPVWEAEYVLSDYGTGAIMAVPGHDERDFEFAKKYNLAIKNVIEPLFIDTTEQGKVREGVETVERNAVMVIVKHWAEDKYIGLRWKKVDWRTLITGAAEGGQSTEEGAMTEIMQETGYLHPKFVRKLTKVHSKFYHVPKKVNRLAHFDVLCFELEDGDRQELSDEEKEIHEVEWLTKEEMTNFLSPEAHKYTWREFLRDPVYEGDGLLVESGEFSGQDSLEAKAAIAQKFGSLKTSYKLRDWVFSRQRYWGEPIPMVYCEKDGWVALPESELPLTLPEVEEYEPTDSGESPLSSVESWVNTTCPKCGGLAKRETDTMPNWAGSSWYFLRYVDSKNSKEFASREKLDYWMPVDWYNGDTGHTTLHLLYSRFWYKFLSDLKLVPGNEPYKKRTSHGHILAEGGGKMSKSKPETIIDPASITEHFGADTLRVYEMFMGPFEQMIAWNDDSLTGPRRFLEKVWKLGQKISNSQFPISNEVLMHQTIKKVSDDVEVLGFNTAVSTLMIYTNALEKQEKVSQEEYETLLKLLAPFAPHITEELWHELGHADSIHTAPWPEHDAAKLVASEVTIVVQVNGKVREKFVTSSTIDESEAVEKAKSLPEMTKWIGDKSVAKAIYVPGKLVNLVIS